MMTGPVMVTLVLNCMAPWVSVTVGTLAKTISSSAPLTAPQSSLAANSRASSTASRKVQLPSSAVTSVPTVTVIVAAWARPAAVISNAASTHPEADQTHRPNERFRAPISPSPTAWMHAGPRR